MLRTASVNKNTAWSTFKVFRISPSMTYTIKVFPIRADRLSDINFNRNFIMFPFFYIFEYKIDNPNNIKNSVGVN